jgi:3-hydroxyisobutyrate dehydrogenase
LTPADGLPGALQSHFRVATLKPDPQDYLQKDFAALMETMAPRRRHEACEREPHVPTGLEG